MLNWNTHFLEHNNILYNFEHNIKAKKILAVPKSLIGNCLVLRSLMVLHFNMDTNSSNSTRFNPYFGTKQCISARVGIKSCRVTSQYLCLYQNE